MINTTLKTRRHSRGIAAVLLACSAVFPLPVFAGDTWFGFAMRVEASGFFLNPKVESATVKNIRPDSQAAQLGVDNGDQVIALEDCAIPGCRGRKARKLMNTPEGETRNFTFRKSDGSIVDVRLTAVPWE